MSPHHAPTPSQSHCIAPVAPVRVLLSLLAPFLSAQMVKVYWLSTSSSLSMMTVSRVLRVPVVILPWSTHETQ